jgi:hypothetical protein
MLIRSALFWDITRRHVLIVYRRFGTTYGAIFKDQKSKKKRLLTVEDGTDTLSRNVGKPLPHDAA